MEITNTLLRLLTCPVTGDRLLYDREAKELISLGARLAFPVADSIPILLPNKARKINPANYSYLADSENYDIGQAVSAERKCEVA